MNVHIPKPLPREKYRPRRIPTDREIIESIRRTYITEIEPQLAAKRRKHQEGFRRIRDLILK